MKRHAVSITVLAITSVLCGPAYADLSDGLVAYWPFNGNAIDESANTYDGTVHGATLASDRFGNPDSAYSFDGAGDYIDIGASIITGDSYTYSLWARRNGTGLTHDTIICNWSNNEGGPALIDWGVITADEIRCLAGEWQSGFILFKHPYESSDWTHIVLVRSGDDTSAYVNGTEVAPTGPIPPAHSTGIFLIGRYHLGSPDTRYFDGLIDDIRVYDRALSEAEIGQLYAPDAVLNVEIDIRPGDCTNKITIPPKNRERIRIQVALLGSAAFDVLTVDPTSVTLEGVAPIHVAVADSASPDCSVAEGDGYDDLMLHFRADEVLETLAVSDDSTMPLTLSGYLQDGSLIEGAQEATFSFVGKPD